MSVDPRGNRGGFGWDEPFIRPGMRPLTRAEVEWLAEMARQQHAAAAGQKAAPRAPVPEGTIDMIEINGVWMTPADAHAALLQIGQR